MTRLSALSRAVGWPALYRRLVEARLIARHYADAIVDLRAVGRAVRALPRFHADRARYEHLAGAPRLQRVDDAPQLHDWTDTHSFDPHYFHQDSWAARRVFELRPERHVDVGSRITFVAGLTPFVEVHFVDIRPLEAAAPGLVGIAGSVTEMPFDDRSVTSLSCLHVAEHVGLGRYGDELDPNGTLNAARELERILAPGGQLLFSLPVGEPRTAFNGHRVHDPTAIPAMFGDLELVEFAAVDDAGRFREDLSPADLVDAAWSCGLYRFARPA